MSDASPSSIRRFRIGANVLMQVLAVCVLVAAANWLAFRHWRKYDFSRERDHTLTARTTAFLNELQKPVRLVVFFGNSSPIFADVNLLVERYRATSPRIEVESINPYRDQSRASELAARFKVGREENLVIVECEGRSKIVGADDLAEWDRSGAALGQPARVVAFRGEAAITGAMLEVVEPSRGVIYLLRGLGGPELGATSPIRIFTTLLERENLKIAELSLANAAAVPADAAAVFIVGAKYDPSEPDIALLRQYWERNGRFLILLDPNSFTPRLQAWLGSLGMVLQDDRLFGNFGPPVGIVNTVISEFLGGTSLAQKFQGVEPTFAGGTATFALEPARVSPAGLRTVGLLQAKKGYWATPEWRTAGVRAPELNPARDRQIDLIFAGTVEREDAPAESSSTAPPRGGRLVAVANATYLLDDNLTQPGADFTLAAVNWSLRREALVGIPPRAVRSFSVTIPEPQLQRIFQITVLLIPALAAALGIFVWRRRRA